MSELEIFESWAVKMETEFVSPIYDSGYPKRKAAETHKNKEIRIVNDGPIVVGNKPYTITEPDNMRVRFSVVYLREHSLKMIDTMGRYTRQNTFEEIEPPE